MTDPQTLLDQFEIEMLRGEFADAGMVRDYDRFASLFTVDGVWRIPEANIEFVSRAQIRAGIERLQGTWDYLVQNTHPGTVVVDGDTAVGRAYVSEIGRFRDGKSQQNYSVYHDRYERTADGWKFAERAYEVLYLDTTPLEGGAPHEADGAYPTKRDGGDEA